MKTDQSKAKCHSRLTGFNDPVGSLDLVCNNFPIRRFYQLHLSFSHKHLLLSRCLRMAKSALVVSIVRKLNRISGFARNHIGEKLFYYREIQKP